jgi:hypothetical protein
MFIGNRLFGFLVGATLAGSGTYYYVLQDYKASNELLQDDIYVRCRAQLKPRLPLCHNLASATGPLVHTLLFESYPSPGLYSSREARA